jgi:ketosteroid isomerase-like protein
VDDPRNVVERQLHALNAHDLDALADCFHEDLHSEDFVHPSQSFVGRDQVVRNWQRVISQVPDLKAEVTGTAVDGDTVWAEWRMYGTHRGGQMFDVRGVTVSKVRDGRIASSRRYLAPIEPGTETVDDYFRRLVEPAT